MIVPYDEVEEALGLTAANSLATKIHKRVERLVKNYVGYEVEQGTFIEYLPRSLAPYNADLFDNSGSDTQADARLYLKNVPIREIVSVHYNPEMVWTGDFLLDTDAYRLDLGEDGLSESGYLLSNVGYWDFLSPRGIRVEYVGGWTVDELDDIASDFKLAVLQSVQKFYNEIVTHQAATKTAGVGAVTREELGLSRINYDPKTTGLNVGMLQGLPLSAKQILANRVRMGAYF